MGKVIRISETSNEKAGKLNRLSTIIRRNRRRVVLTIIILILVLIWMIHEGPVIGGEVLTILALILVLIWIVYEHLATGRWPDWTGFGGYITPEVPKDRKFERGKTFWDWMQLLIIPAVLAGGAYWLNESMHQSDQAIANDNRQNDLAIANDNRQEDALQTYIDRMSDLLIKENLSESIQGNISESKNISEVRVVARARTLTVLRRLDGDRKGALIRFIYEADLIKIDKRVIELNDADLRAADLSFADLSRIDLSRADLSGADLRAANLSNADLSVANMSEANLAEADLSGADLVGTNLSNADMSLANLKGADLNGVILSGAIYTKFTIWPKGFDPDAIGAINVSG